MDPGLCQATSSRRRTAPSGAPAYARLHHREAQQHSQQPRPMPSYIIARHSIILSKTGLCQATLGTRCLKPPRVVWVEIVTILQEHFPDRLLAEKPFRDGAQKSLVGNRAQLRRRTVLRLAPSELP